MEFTEGARLQVYNGGGGSGSGGDGGRDGDRGVLCELMAAGVELSGRRLPLGGGGGDSGCGGEPGSSACVVTGLRFAVAAAAVSAAATAISPLRPLLLVDRFGGSLGPVLTPPRPPGEWDSDAEPWGSQTQSEAESNGETTNQKQTRDANERAADIELMGATLDVSCADAAVLDANIAAAVASFKSSASCLAPAKATTTETAAAAGAKLKTATTTTTTTTKVTLIDICVRGHAVMSPAVGPGLAEDAIPAATAATCALELSVPLSQVTIPGGEALKTVIHSSICVIEAGPSDSTQVILMCRLKYLCCRFRMSGT